MWHTTEAVRGGHTRLLLHTHDPAQLVDDCQCVQDPADLSKLIMRLLLFMEHKCTFALALILRKLSVVNTLNPCLSVICFNVIFQYTLWYSKNISSIFQSNINNFAYQKPAKIWGSVIAHSSAMLTFSGMFSQEQTHYRWP
jgi:hypothetical protein